jgi:NAD(P)-dependent dehydrogenase (short-subunit alcohol dehydrogenase family)
MLLAEGVRVWGTSRDPARLPVRDGFTPVALDLAAAPAEIEAAFVRAEGGAGGFDLVINNAGYGRFGPFAGTDFAGWRAQLEAMLGATLQLSHLALQGMLARNHGALVNVSSLAVEFPLPFMSGYNVVKSGLSALSESLIIETADTGIIVIDFRPGDYRTRFNQAMHSLSSTPPPSARLQRVWTVLEKNLAAGPAPAHAAGRLRGALRRGRSGVVRSGDFFQAGLAPFGVRFIPAALRRAVQAWYFGAG